MASEKITALIKLALNRPVQPSLAQSLIRFYTSNPSLEAFTLYCSAFGLKDLALVATIHAEIAGSDVSVGLNSMPQPTQSRSQFSLEDRHHESDNGPDYSQSIPSGLTKTLLKTKPKRIIAFDDIEDDVEASTGPVSALSEPSDRPQAKPKKSLFKKIKKDKAFQIKTEREKDTVLTIETNPGLSSGTVDAISTSSAASSRSSLSQLASLERGQRYDSNSPSVQEYMDADDHGSVSIVDDDSPDSLENDREWYMAEEGVVIHDYDDVYEGPNETEFHTKSTSSKFNNQIRNQRPNNSSIGGGLFNAAGEYVDYDHDTDFQGLDLSRMALTTHSLVPPFLEDSKEHLSVVLTNIGPTINPVKDPTSELALAARTGSAVVRERKSATEKARHARDRANLAGTALGNVLGVKHEEPQETEHNSKQNLDTNSGETNYLSILEQRRSLPAFLVREGLLNTIRENQVTIVIGETGSGKTTQLTQFLYEDGFAKSDNNLGFKMIGCTQPRRVAAVSVAERVAQEMNVKVGQECGYSIRFEDITSSKTVIKYLTEGILLREVLMDPNLEKYSCIIMDEAHERLLNTDVLLGLFKQILARRRDLKLIVTSATLNADRFSRFFGDAPQFTIPGRTFPVEVMYSRSSVTDYVEAAVKQVLTIHLKKENHHEGLHNGDILVFMTGQEDVEATCEILQAKLDELDNVRPIDILPIYSTLSNDLQKKIFAKSNPKRRKCVVATNIAETSLTVDGIRFVVDSGLSKVKVFNPKLGMDALQIVPISYANAQQRSGRAGRTASGIAYRMYTERASNPQQMYVQPVPEIQRTNLANVVLQLRSLEVNDIIKFPFLDPPPQDLLACSLYDLWAMGALDSVGDLTTLGRDMNKFPMDPSMAKLILKSIEYGCSEEIVIIISMLLVPNVWNRPKERARDADTARERFEVSMLDHLTLHNVYIQWERVPPSKRLLWCSKNFLHHKLLLRAREILTQLIQILKSMGLKLQKADDRNDYEIVRKCICSAYFHQAAKLSRLNHNRSAEYFHLRHNFMKMYVHPTSALNGNISLLYVVYNELILTSKEFMSCITAVDPLWLAELGGIFYGIPKLMERKAQETGTAFKTKEQHKEYLEQERERWINKNKLHEFKRKKPTSNQNQMKIKRRGGF